MVEQYSSYVAVDDVKLNGELTLAENIADGVGAKLAYLAFQNRAKNSLPAGKLRDGFSRATFLPFFCPSLMR